MNTIMFILISTEEGSNEVRQTILSEEEARSFVAIADFAGMEPHEFVWACIDTVMNSSDDEYVLFGCREASERRFQGYVLPEWAQS